MPIVTCRAYRAYRSNRANRPMLYGTNAFKVKTYSKHKEVNKHAETNETKGVDVGPERGFYVGGRDLCFSVSVSVFPVFPQGMAQKADGNRQGTFAVSLFRCMAAEEAEQPCVSQVSQVSQVLLGHLAPFQEAEARQPSTGACDCPCAYLCAAYGVHDVFPVCTFHWSHAARRATSNPRAR